MNTVNEIVECHLSTKPVSSSDLFDKLEQIGVVGPMAQVIVQQSGHQRHLNRIQSVREDCKTFTQETGLPGHYLLAFDTAGIGGTKFARARSRFSSEAMGLTGEGTCRVPGLRARSKQSGPGAAWTSAIEAAASEIQTEFSESGAIGALPLNPKDLMPTIDFSNMDASDESKELQRYALKLDEYRCWIQSLAFQVMTGTLPNVHLWTIQGEPSDWAQLFNEWEGFDPSPAKWRVTRANEIFETMDEYLAKEKYAEWAPTEPDSNPWGVELQYQDRRSQQWIDTPHSNEENDSEEEK